jgi:pimeloyl-ACP methyl ester carboxylesterase
MRAYRPLWLLPLALLACGPEEGLPPEDTASPAPTAAAVPDADVGTARAELVNPPGLTSHFRTWLTNNGYGGDNFARTDLSGGSYGGKASDADAVTKQPVIFIHGNSDRALSYGSTSLTGWTASINAFEAAGYRPRELYATTWGPANAAYSSQQYHSKTNVMRVRRFIEAVLAYTGAAKVDVIGHSMGVTLARKAIKGGWASDAANGGDYYVGGSLTSRVDTFVGIAGANRGLVACYQTGPSTPTCGSTNGLYPGYWNGVGVSGRSNFLQDLYSGSGYEGAYRYSLFSTEDNVIGYGNVVYYEYTSRIPGQTGERVFTSSGYGHNDTKDRTGAIQVRMVRDHATN